MHRILGFLVVIFLFSVCAADKKPKQTEEEQVAAQTISNRLTELGQLIFDEVAKPSDSDGKKLRELTAERIRLEGELAKVSNKNLSKLAKQPAQKASPEKKAKPKKVKSASEFSCREDFTDPHKQRVCFEAQARESRKAAEKANKKEINLQPKSMKEIYKDEEKAKKREKNTKKAEERAIKESGMTGCDPNEIWVNPRYVNDGTGFVHATINIKNVGPNMITSITEGRNTVVENLCPGGYISVVKWLPFWDGIHANINIEVSFVANGVAPDGRPLTAIQTVNLQSNYGTRYERPYNWLVDLR